MKRYLIFLGLLSGLLINAVGEVRLTNENGFGARALSFSNNFVAISNDISAIYWNPAALSFSLVREIQATIDASSFEGEFSFLGNNETSKMNHLKISNAGLMYSFPATQGGLTIALSYSNPIVFDEFSEQAGWFNFDGAIYRPEKTFRTSGGLRFLSTGFGLQVAPRLALGATVSFVYGSDIYESKALLNITKNQFWLDSANVYKNKGKYTGYDVRLGALYKHELFSAGLRFTLPQIIKFKETADEQIQMSYSYKEPEYFHYNDKYKAKLYSSYMGAAGAALTLPFFTLTAEARATLPFGFVFSSEEIPQSSQANRYKVGGGAGIEFPVPGMPMLIRSGYSFDEIDLHRYVSKYGEYFNESSWSNDNINIDRDKHQISAGVGLFNSNFSFDVSYCYSTWKFTHKLLLAEKTLDSPQITDNLIQDYSLHKVMVSLAVRY